MDFRRVVLRRPLHWDALDCEDYLSASFFSMRGELNYLKWGDYLNQDTICMLHFCFTRILFFFFISIDDDILLKGIYYESLDPKRIWLILQRSFVSHVVIRQVERYVLYPHSLHSNKLYLDCRTITFLTSRISMTTGLIYSTCKLYHSNTPT